jgi:penicillin-binding protein 2
MRPPRSPLGGPRRPGGGGRSPLTPRGAVRIAAFGVITIGLIAVLLIQLWFLQVVRGGQYEQQAEANRLRTVITEAPRGVITDRNGTPVVSNRAGQDVVGRPQDLTGPRGREVLARLARTLDVPVRDLVRRVAQARQNAPYENVVLAEDVPLDLQAYLQEQRRAFPGVSLQSVFLRDYPRGATAAHVLGTVGAITPEEFQAFRRRGYLGNERVGQSGLEATYEQYLRGVAGRSEVEVDAQGAPVGRGVISSSPPVPGNTLRLSIDLPTQLALQRALKAQVRLAGLSTGAAGVAMDPRTGEILAIASYPTFRPDVFVSGSPRQVRGLLRDGSQPLLNRAIAGQYPAGSTYKPISSTAAIEDGYTTPDEELESPGVIELYDREWQGFRKRDHGIVDVRSALEVSSDTYYYQLAARMYESQGRTSLQEWSRRYGLGRPSGIDVGGESSGLVPDRAWKRSICTPGALECSWLPGDSINMSIGQGNVLVTPLQMATAYAAVANGGTLVTPTIASAVLDQDGRVLRNLVAGRPRREIRPAIDEATLGAIREGLFRASNGDEGTATAVFGNLPEPYRVAGKTGTAENPPNPDHSWFVGYAPATRTPRIVVAVVVERGGTGASAAAPVVCQTMAAYLDFRPGRCGEGGEAN